MKNTIIEYENLAKLNDTFLKEYQDSFTDTVKRGWFILGENVAAFEKEFAAYCGTSNCVGVANGLDALILALRALNFEKGSQIIVQSNTYIATILSILHAELVPVLVEPDIETYNIDPTKIEEKITSKTKAIIVVHLYGKMSKMDAIINIAKNYDLSVIEDCAQAHGAKFKNVKAGYFGDINAFSFYPTKNLGALGDAGAITTNNIMLAESVGVMRNYGSKRKYYNEVAGVNSRLDELQAAFLSIKLKRLDTINIHKRKLADLYHTYLKPDFIKPKVDADYYDIFHIYNIRHSERDKLRDYLRQNNIGTEVHYPVAPNKQKAMANIFTNIETPIAEEIHQTTLSLPISFFHTEENILHVIEILNKF